MLIKLTERSEHITGDVTYSHDNTKLTGDAAVYVSRKSRTLDACLLNNFKPSPERREKLEWFTPSQTNGFNTGNRREKRNSSFRKFPEVIGKKEALLI